SSGQGSLGISGPYPRNALVTGNRASSRMVAYPEMLAAAGGPWYGEARCCAVVAFSSHASICGDIFISWGPPILTLWGHGQSKSLFLQPRHSHVMRKPTSTLGVYRFTHMARMGPHKTRMKTP